MVKKKKPPKNTDNSWKEYLELLRQWIHTFESLQRINTELQIKYLELMGKALSDSKNINMISQLVENWQKLTSQFWQEQLMYKR
ncbi:MAG: hypothetical protein AUH25_06875 [Thaumarchaeota archaeon 13_1_40CM_38_12]|nr:MAG: hypothetical protein AUH25_06875 [Thaumarchaeota archaeon 13_1_40CM_38_12]OLC91460.1 MAG: hypothetical protein AUI92_07645 [Thaumarchaeota archaeon 13_1_40CM_3_38_6]OLD40467.1 MAG: hypothetical protein AUI60_04685 [Thaumarchaeota archaeon 13_1_40CM_2_39_4]